MNIRSYKMTFSSCFYFPLKLNHLRAHYYYPGELITIISHCSLRIITDGWKVWFNIRTCFSSHQTKKVGERTECQSNGSRTGDCHFWRLYVTALTRCSGTLLALRTKSVASKRTSANDNRTQTTFKVKIVLNFSDNLKQYWPLKLPFFGLFFAAYVVKA